MQTKETMVRYSDFPYYFIPKCPWTGSLRGRVASARSLVAERGSSSASRIFVGQLGLGS